MFNAAQETAIQRQKRLTMLLVVLCAALVMVGGRFFYWQAICDFRDDDIKDHRSKNIPYLAKRGNILDATGHHLVMDVSHYNICCDPFNLKTDEERADLAARVVPATNRTQDEIFRLLVARKDYRYLRLAVNVPRAKLDLIPEKTTIHLEPVPNRAYPEGPLAAQVLGLVNAKRQGVSGIEAHYNDVLTGTNGIERIISGPWGEYEHLLRPPVDGHDLVLTINRVIQLEVEKVLEQTVLQQRADGGTIIVMDPHTGAILAMANYPSYDPNRYAEHWLVETERIPNPAVSKHHEPGSVFKIVTLAAGLDHGTIQPNSVYEDTGVIRVGGRDISNYGGQAYGTTNMVGLLAHSSNVGAAIIARDMRAPAFYEYLSAFGFGQKTDVDLADELPGIMHKPGDPLWSESNLATNSFGQGIAVTPLQMVSAVAIVANGGVRVQPHIVQGIRQGDQVEAKTPPPGPRVISEQTARDLTRLLVEALEVGAPAACIWGYSVAGKTGTAQIPIPGGYSRNVDDVIASFVGYAPADDPKFVILIKIDRPKVERWGVSVAAPAFRALAPRLFSLLDVPPDAYRMAAQQ